LKKYLKIVVVFLFSITTFAQHQYKVNVVVNDEQKTLSVFQEITFYNQTNDTISKIILNDWNNAYSSNDTPLAERFSDEFVRSFHFASEKEKGSTQNLNIFDENKFNVNWCRYDAQPDIVELSLKNKIAPGQKTTFTLTYQLNIPSDKFTKYGYGNNGVMYLKNCFLNVARFENKKFVQYENLNIDDMSNSLFNLELNISTPNNFSVQTDFSLNEFKNQTHTFKGTNLLQYSIYIEPINTFSIYKNQQTAVSSNLVENKLSDINKALIVDHIVNYCTEKLGVLPQKYSSVSQIDYELNPFYGLNQLPSFISPFSDGFIYELKFLKTYLNNVLKNNLNLDQRKDNWVFDAIQIYYMMQYIDENYPNAKMMGTISKLKLLRGYNLVSLDFNGQYSYFYMLMARKNLDQPLGDSKSTLIKFNERIASKYRAGLSLKYLEEYIGKENLNKAIKEFISFASQNQTNDLKFQEIIKNNTEKDLNWFFNIIIDSRDIIDYKFKNVEKSKYSVSFTLKSKTNVWVPIPVYGLKNKNIVFKEWIYKVQEDSTYTFDRKNADKIVLNYKNEVPEFNQRNNWKTLKNFSLSNKPIKFIFLKDLENPFYNQIVFVPSIEYNFYDGLIPGMRFNNKTILDRPINIDLNPSFSTKSKNFSGSFSFVINQFRRNSNLFNIRYGISGESFQYAPEATYKRLNTYVNFRIREYNYRDNHRQSFTIRNIFVNREKSNLVTNNFEGEYSVLNFRYNNTKTEITKHLGFFSDVQISKNFGKISGEISYRKLFLNNTQINFRMYLGKFLYNTTNSNYFNFALDRPTDYLFDYNYLGRSESTGLFSQQFIWAEGGFKSKLQNPFSNDWIATTNLGVNLWNWIEVYGDLGFLKNQNIKQKFVYDSGIRLNLVTDYLEFYLPIYSNNGWEISQPKYAEKIRFIATISTSTITSLFTRKWF
jgi:hypothetical protein